MIEAPPSDARLIGWAAFRAGVPVTFWWHAVHWRHNSQKKIGERNQNVWANPVTFDTRDAKGEGDFANGEGVLLYPGRDRLHPEEDRGIDGPISTLRLANLRRGLQDHLYLTLARQRGLDALVAEVLVRSRPLASSARRRAGSPFPNGRRRSSARASAWRGPWPAPPAVRPAERPPPRPPPRRIPEGGLDVYKWARRGQVWGMEMPSGPGRSSVLPRFCLALAVVLSGAGADGRAGNLPAVAGAPSPPVPIPGDEHSWAEPNRTRVSHVKLALTLDFEGHIARGTPSCSSSAPRRTRPWSWTRAASRSPASPAPTAGAVPSDRQGGRQAGRSAHHRARARGPAGAHRLPHHRALRGAAVARAGADRGRKAAVPLHAGPGDPDAHLDPVQDTPGVRVTYDATLRVPDGPDGGDERRAARARTRAASVSSACDQPIPSYLIALAVGDIEFRPISTRAAASGPSRPWSKPRASEFTDTEQMVADRRGAVRTVPLGPLRPVVLPPSFPFGGMENPRLTFATPTILAGDKSLVSLVAHELAHSWSGNLVTNATWRDFWLNEGFTVYFEQRIMEARLRRRARVMERQLAAPTSWREMATLEPREQVLHIDLRAAIPTTASRACRTRRAPVPDAPRDRRSAASASTRSCARWFDGHAFQSVTTTDSRLDDSGAARHRPARPPASTSTWLEKPGLPADAPRTPSLALGRVDVERERFLPDAARSLDTKGWVTQQWQHFIKTLPADLPLPKMAELDAAFGFTRSGNSEILSDWLLLAIKLRYAPADARLTEFLLTCGRRKFLKPLYAELARTEDGKKRARDIYTKARPRYHAVATSTIDQILGWKI